MEVNNSIQSDNANITMPEEVTFIATGRRESIIKLEPERSSRQSNSLILFIVLIVNLLAISGDITMTWTSPMLSKLYSNDSSINPLPKPITKDQDALIASLINIGAMVGALPFAYLSDHYGRKCSLLVIGIFHMVAYSAMAFGSNVMVFYFGRIFGGLAVGGGYAVLPMYIAEIAEESKRGLYLVTLAIFWSIGNFLPYLIGPFLSVKIFNLVNLCFPLTFFIIFCIVGTETPFYLVGNNKIIEAYEILKKLRSVSDKELRAELKHIQDTLKEEEDSSSSFKIIFTNAGIRKAFIISISLIVLQQLSGWNGVTFYLEPIFQASGIELSAEISSLIIGAAIFIFALPLPYLVEKFNRKTLLIFSATVMGIFLILLGVFFTVLTRTNLGTKSISWLPVTSLIVIAFAFQVGFSSIPWTISAEIFPKNVKKLSSSVTSASCWVTSFLITQLFNYMTEIFGFDGTFYLYAIFSFVCSIFTIIYVPETRGKTFAEIQRLLQI